jgi:hypothetical protein
MPRAPDAQRPASATPTREVLLLAFTSVSFGLAVGNVFFSSLELGPRQAIAAGAALAVFALGLLIRR